MKIAAGHAWNVWPDPEPETVADEVGVRLTWTVEEAGRLLGIGRNGAYQAARRGEIPTIRLGRRLVVPRAALRQFLAATPERPAAPVREPEGHEVMGASPHDRDPGALCLTHGGRLRDCSGARLAPERPADESRKPDNWPDGVPYYAPPTLPR